MIVFCSLIDIKENHIDQYIENIPTCGIVKINFKTNNWSDCSNGVIEFKLFPKNLNP